MPPLKKFKPAESNIHAPNPFASDRASPGQGAMFNLMMNGPTLSPQGPISPPVGQNGNASPAPAPPPGLRSPPAPPAYTNGYTHHGGLQNGRSRARLSLSPRASQGTPENSSKTPNVGWSARYSWDSKAAATQQPAPTSTQPQNPFLNSFHRQRPSSSPSTHEIPSPIANRPSLSPPQSSRSTAFPGYSTNPTANGVGQSPKLSSLSPVKQQSSPPRPTVYPTSSSPIIRPPLRQNAPPSPGLSPTKQSPPRSFKSQEGVTPVMPSVSRFASTAPQELQTQGNAIVGEGAEEMVNGMGS